MKTDTYNFPVEYIPSRGGPIMQCKQRLEAYLQKHHVPYQLQHHAQAFSAQKIAEREHVPGKTVAKSVIVMVDSQLIELVLPASYQVDLNKLQSILGARDIRLAHESEFANVFPDCEVGAMPPFGNHYGIAVYVDKRLTEEETIVFPVGTHTDTMSLKYADFERLVHPIVVGLAHTYA
jgi:Ala-tRNA(Pro) deacylase